VYCGTGSTQTGHEACHEAYRKLKETAKHVYQLAVAEPVITGSSPPSAVQRPLYSVPSACHGDMPVVYGSKRSPKRPHRYRQ